MFKEIIVCLLQFRLIEKFVNLLRMPLKRFTNPSIRQKLRSSIFHEVFDHQIVEYVSDFIAFLYWVRLEYFICEAVYLHLPSLESLFGPFPRAVSIY
jgi:hypothetical protein